jgi:hypothetical protein
LTFKKQPSYILILPPILTHLTLKDLNFPKYKKYPFPFAFKFQRTHTRSNMHTLY